MTETTMRVAGGFELEFVLPLGTVALTIAGAIAICVLSVALQRSLGRASTPGVDLG